VQRSVEIDSSVFQVAPVYLRSVLAAVGPGVAEDPPALEGRFGAVVNESVASLGGADVDFTKLPVIELWRDAFKAAGWSASKFRSSIEALLRRAARGELQPLGVPLIDAGTIATLECQVPIGVHILDDVPDGVLYLGPALGTERFEALDGSVEHPDVGEIVYKCAETVLTRRWVWRQGRVGSVFGQPQCIAVNVDVIDPDRVNIDNAVQTITDLLDLCGVPVVGRLDLSRTNPAGEISGWA